jgi:hypothetical protein
MSSLPVRVIIETHDGERATLVTGGGHRFSWPAAHLPPCAPGDALCLDIGAFASAPVDDGHRLAAARAMLNELLTAT